MKQQKKNHVKLDYFKPNLVNYCLTSGIVLVLTLTNLVEKAYAPCLALVIAFVISSILFWIKPIPQVVKSFLLPMSPAALNFVLVLFDKTSPTYFTVMVACLIMGSLYFQDKLVVAHTIVVNVLTVIAIYIVGNGLLTSDMPVSEGINHIIRMDIAAIILYLLTRRGYIYIYEAYHAKHEAEDLLKQLNDIMDSARKTIDLLDEGILSTGESVKEAGISSGAVMAATTQMASGITKQSQSAGEVSTLATDSIEKMEKTSSLSKSVVDTSQTLHTEVEDNRVQVNRMYDEIQNIHSSTDSTYETVVKLQENMKDINNLLNDIAGIAGQTNLLALNASIEAARAGEQGKGFAVVADEVKNLAAQTQQIATNIVSIIKDINSSTNETLNQVLKEKDSIESGSSIMDSLQQSFQKMQSGFQSLREEIKQENTYINEVVEAYDRIMTSVKSIADISLDHSATAEEICASVEDQNAHLSHIGSQMLSLKEQSASLRNKVNL